MNRRANATTVLTVILCLIVSFFGGASLAAPRPSHPAVYDPISAIEADYHAGALTFSQKALLQITAIKHLDQLPSKYRAAGMTRSGGRSATLAIRDILLNWKLLDVQTQQVIAQALTRFNTAFTYISPSGFFKLHYDTTGGNAVLPTDNDLSGVPDYVEHVAAYLDTTYTKHMALGYLQPPSDGTQGGDSKFDVYFQEMSQYGYAVPEADGPAPWNDKTSYLVLHRNFVDFPANTDPEGNVAGAAKVTAAHEFHHCVQFAYDAGEPIWFMELDATCMEDIIYDQVNDNYNYLPLFMSDPQISIMDGSYHMYGSFLWAMYLAERFDTSLVRAAWEGARYKSIFNALSDSLQGRYGWSQDSAFAEFTVWNYFSGSRDDGQHYSEGAAYQPNVAIDGWHTAYPVNLQSAPVQPQGYGACYIRFGPNTSFGELRIAFDGDNATEWAAYLIKELPNGTHSTEKLDLKAPNWTDTIAVPDFRTYASVTLVGINIKEFDGARGFTYSAYIQAPYPLTVAMATDSQIYSGASRVVNVRVRNQSITSNPIKVSYSDAAGWVTPGSTSVILGAGDSTLIGVIVHVPPGTSLGTVSNLTFTGESLNDPLVTQTCQRNEVVVVQRGDVNFSGNIDVSDLSQLIAYLLGSGPQPVPVMESGNFNCQGIVDVSDLSALISYLTGSGGKSPCNPY